MEWAYILYIQFLSLELVIHQKGQLLFHIAKFWLKTPTKGGIILIDGLWLCIHTASACPNC